MADTSLYIIIIAAVVLSIIAIIRTYGGSGGAVSSVNAQTGAVVLDTDDISEGVTNKYFSDSLARLALVQGSYVDYNSGTGTISLDYTPPTNTIYVEKTGNDGTADGSFFKPFLTIQAAHNYAASNIPAANNVHIMIGPGDYNESVTITRVKTMLIGATDSQTKTTSLNTITVNVTTSVSGVFNDIISIDNLLLSNSSASSILTLGGNQRYTFIASRSYLFTDGATGACLQVTNTSVGGIKVRFMDCILQNTSSSAVCAAFTNTFNGRFDLCTLYAGSNSCMSITTSNISAYNTTFQTTTGSNVINAISSLGTPFNPITAPTGSIAFVGGNCTFTSTTTNGSGIVMSANASSVVAQCSFVIPVGTGSSVGGSATCYFINGNNLVFPGTNSTVAGTVTRLNMTAL